MDDKKRLSLDIVKIIAICLVIYNHTGGYGYELYKYGENDVIKCAAAFFNTFCKTGVGLFFMVSGALLLGKKESVIVVIKKRVARFGIILILFSFIYYIRFFYQNPGYGFSIKYFITYIYSHSFITPFWFLYIYLSFLLMLPILRAVVCGLDESGYMYLFIITIVFNYIPVLEKILNLEPVNLFLGMLQMNVVYPILGYGIANIIGNKYFSKRNAIIGTVLLLINCTASVYMTISDVHLFNDVQSDYVSIFSVFVTFFIFYIAIYAEKNIQNIKITNKLIKAISYIAGCTLCIYLFEEMLRIDIFIKIFDFSENAGQVMKWLLCIPYTLSIIVSGAIIAFIIGKIPVIKKLKL